MENRKGGFLIAKIHQLSGRIFSKLLRDSGIDELNPAQGRIMFVLWEKDGITITDISEKTQLERSTLTSMLDRLEVSGFIKREPSPGDRRKILIYRTDKDRSYMKKYLFVSDKMLSIFYAGLSDADVKKFESVLENILSNLIKHEINEQEE